VVTGTRGGARLGGRGIAVAVTDTPTASYQQISSPYFGTHCKKTSPYFCRAVHTVCKDTNGLDEPIDSRQLDETVGSLPSSQSSPVSIPPTASRRVFDKISRADHYYEGGRVHPRTLNDFILV